MFVSSNWAPLTVSFNQYPQNPLGARGDRQAQVLPLSPRRHRRGESAPACTPSPSRGRGLSTAVLFEASRMASLATQTWICHLLRDTCGREPEPVVKQKWCALWLAASLELRAVSELDDSRYQRPSKRANNQAIGIEVSIPYCLCQIVSLWHKKSCFVHLTSAQQLFKQSSTKLALIFRYGPPDNSVTFYVSIIIMSSSVCAQLCP